MRHKDLFEQQKLSSESSHVSCNPEHENMESFIKFDSGDTAFLVPISSVREIADEVKVVPYPQVLPGHIGLISLRGEILPVIDLGLRADGLDSHRMIVLEFEEGAPFCLYAHQIRKIAVSARVAAQEMINVDGKAARVLRMESLAHLKGVEA